MTAAKSPGQDAICSALESSIPDAEQQLRPAVAQRSSDVTVEEHVLSPMDTEGIIGVFAWSACDHEGCRRCVALKREKATPMANAKQCVMRAKQEEACQELHEAINCMNERQGRLSKAKFSYLPGGAH